MLELPSSTTPTAMEHNNNTAPPTATLPPIQPSSGGTSPNPNYLSTVGAFNGSGLAVASQSFDSGATDDVIYGKLDMYFQHHTGSIRRMQLRDNGWEGGQESDTVVGEGVAKNGTAISAVSYDVAAVSLQRSLRSRRMLKWP